MKKKNKRRVLLIAIIFLTILTACGGDSKLEESRQTVLDLTANSLPSGSPETSKVPSATNPPKVYKED